MGYKKPKWHLSIASDCMEDGLCNRKHHVICRMFHVPLVVGSKRATAKLTRTGADA